MSKHGNRFDYEINMQPVSTTNIENVYRIVDRRHGGEVVASSTKLYFAERIVKLLNTAEG